MKKKLISAFTATAMVATVVPAAVTQAAPATLKIDSVVAVDSNNVKVTYTVNQKKYTETVKTSKVIKHGATIVSFKLKGNNYSAKLSKPFSNKNYVSVTNNVNQGNAALKSNSIDTAEKALKNAQTFFARLKTTEVSSSQYSVLKNKITQLEQAIQAASISASFDAQNVFNQSNEKMNAVKSMDVDIAATLKISMLGESMNMNMNGAASIFVSPLLAKYNLTMDMGEAGKETLEMYMEEKANKYYVYMKDSTGWVAEEMDVSSLLDLSSSLNLSSSMNFDGFSSLRAVGMESIDGRDMYVIEGKMLGEDMEKFFKDTGLLGITDVSDLGLTADEEKLMQDLLSKMFKDMGDFTVKMWIDAETYYGVKYEMDLTDFTQKMVTGMIDVVANMDELVGEISTEELNSLKQMLKVEEVKISMKSSNFDNVSTFTIQKEAQDALKK